MITYLVSTPTLRPKKNTVVLAASFRSALRIRCWCCMHNYSVFVLFALVQAAPHSHACPERACAQGCAELVACVRIPRTRCTLLVDCLDLGHESRAALSGQPMHGRRCSLAAQPRVCRAVRLHNTATSPNLMLDPLYQYMRPFELARTVNICSSFGDSTIICALHRPAVRCLPLGVTSWDATSRALPSRVPSCELSCK